MTKMKSDTPAVQRRVLCARHGHPPVVTLCFGYVSCARCEAQIGDTLAGAYDLTNVAVLGHDCEKCREVIAGLTRTQRKMTRLTLSAEPTDA